MITLEALLWNVLEEREGYPCRLLEKQRNWYCGLGAAFRDRALCTAGIRLVFTTDATVLRFSYTAVSFCRSCNVVDFCENGIHTGSVRLADMQYHGEVVFERKTTGKGKIEIWLPNTCGIRITEFDFGDCEPVQKPGERLLILGDSIWQGIASYYPTCSVSNLLCRELGIEIINQSVGGARFFPEMLELLPVKMDNILVSLGINDVFSQDSAEEIERRVCAYFARLQMLYPTSPVTCITPVWTRLLEEQKRMDRYLLITEIIRREAEKLQGRIIDGMELVPHADKFYNEDGVHPNDLGFARYALSLLKNFKE